MREILRLYVQRKNKYLQSKAKCHSDITLKKLYCEDCVDQERKTCSFSGNERHKPLQFE